MFRVIDKENGNYGSCVNRGIKEATGKYFRILDADDQFDTSNFAKFIDILNNTDADMVLTHYCYVRKDRGGKVFNQYRSHKLKYGKIHDADILDFNAIGQKQLLWMHATTYKKEIIDKVGLTLQTGISYTDMEYVFYPLPEVKTILPLDLTLYRYTLGREGQTVSAANHVKDIMHHYMVCRRMTTDFIKIQSNIKSDVIKNNLITVLLSVLGGYYVPVLCTTKRNEDTDKLLREIYHDIDNEAPTVRERLLKQTYHGAPYMKIWIHKGKYLTDYPYNVLYPFMKTLDFFQQKSKGLMRRLFG